VTKSGSNVFKGTAVTTFENDKMQSNNVSQALFYQASSGFLSGNPLKKIANYTVEYGGPIKKNQLWWWAAAGKQDINVGILNFFDPALGGDCQTYAAAQKNGTLGSLTTYDNLESIQGCLANDQTTIVDYSMKGNYQINAANKFQYLFTSDDKVRNHRGASSTTAPEATTGVQRRAVEPAAADALDHAHLDRHGQTGLQQPVHLRPRRLRARLPDFDKWPGEV
jgi:hypothetical protein